MYASASKTYQTAAHLRVLVDEEERGGHVVVPAAVASPRIQISSGELTGVASALRSEQLPWQMQLQEPTSTTCLAATKDADSSAGKLTQGAPRSCPPSRPAVAGSAPGSAASRAPLQVGERSN